MSVIVETSDSTRTLRDLTDVRLLIGKREHLFRPNCNRGCNSGCGFLDRPFIFAGRNYSEAVKLCVLPGGAKTFRVEPPYPSTRVARRPFERFTSHLSVRRKRHFKFRARGRYGGERLASKERCLYLVWCHGLRS